MTKNYDVQVLIEELKIKDIQEWTSSIYLNAGYNTWNISLEYDLNPLIKNQRLKYLCTYELGNKKNIN